MKKYIICILVNLLLVGVLTISNGLALSDPPNMRVSVANTDASNTYLLGSPINLVLILENMDGVLEIKPYEGFSAQDFRHMLDFVYDDGTVIKSNEQESIVYRNGREVPLPDLLYRNGEMLPVETVEFLEPHWWWRGDMDANEVYSLARPGNVLISAKIPIRSYDDIIPETENKALFCDDETRTDCFAGDLEPVEISICITADLDGDGFYSPCLYGSNTVLDCDDSDSNVNPAVNEICDDGIDNNCNDKIDCEDSTCNGDVSCLADSCADYESRVSCKADSRCKWSGKYKACSAIPEAQLECEANGGRWNKKKETCR